MRRQAARASERAAAAEAPSSSDEVSTLPDAGEPPYPSAPVAARCEAVDPPEQNAGRDAEWHDTDLRRSREERMPSPECSDGGRRGADDRCAPSRSVEEHRANMAVLRRNTLERWPRAAEAGERDGPPAAHRRRPDESRSSLPAALSSDRRPVERPRFDDSRSADPGEVQVESSPSDDQTPAAAPRRASRGGTIDDAPDGPVQAEPEDSRPPRPLAAIHYTAEDDPLFLFMIAGPAVNRRRMMRVRNARWVISGTMRPERRSLVLTWEVWSAALHAPGGYTVVLGFYGAVGQELSGSVQGTPFRVPSSPRPAREAVVDVVVHDSGELTVRGSCVVLLSFVQMWPRGARGLPTLPD